MVRPGTFPRETLPSEDGSHLVEPDGRGNPRPRIDIARRVRGDRVVQARRGRQDPDYRT